MARPKFQQSQGEPATPLHLYLKQSQYDAISKLAHDSGTSKAAVVRQAISVCLSRDLLYSEERTGGA